MGLTILNALFLEECWRQGTRFDSTLTLGRLDSFMTPADLHRIAGSLPTGSQFVESIRRGEQPACMDDLFRAMGAKSVDAVDASDYEGASIVHDLNEPLDASLHARFDAVVDGGTLEHVFNVATAFKNVMDALRVGGDFLACLPANNYCGHGFYQFSAELFFGVFSADNGFEVRKLLVAPAYVSGKWLDGPVFEVSDPRTVGERVHVEGSRKMVFLVQARKLKQVPTFSRWPQQVDYSEAWAQRQRGQRERRPGQVPMSPNGWSSAARKIGGIARVTKRFQEQRRWARDCRRNVALRPHTWRI